MKFNEVYKNAVCILGYDGSGKTTLIQYANQLGYKTSSFFDVFPSRKHFSYSELTQRNDLERFLYFKQLTDQWLDLISQNSEGKELLIIDSYITRYFYKEKIFNSSCSSIIDKYLNKIKKPKYCILLELPIEEAFKRNTRLHISDVFPNSENQFEGFQKLQVFVISEAINNFSKFGVEIISFDSTKSILEVKKNFKNLLESIKKK